MAASKTNTAVALDLRNLTTADILRMTKAEREAMLGTAPDSNNEESQVVNTVVALAAKTAASVMNTVEDVPSTFMLAFRAERARAR